MGNFQVNDPRAKGELVRREASAITEDFIKVGLDGNTRFMKPQHGFSKAVEVLAEHGIELDEVVNAWLFNRDSGKLQVDVAFTNKDDPFSPISIRNSMLVLTYHKLAEDKFEVIAYMS